MSVFLRKVSRIVRGRYSRLTLQAVRVRLKNRLDEWYDVYIFNDYNNVVYMDCLDENELNELIRALSIVCLNIVRTSQFEDGILMVFDECR